MPFLFNQNNSARSREQYRRQGQNQQQQQPQNPMFASPFGNALFQNSPMQRQMGQQQQQMPQQRQPQQQRQMPQQRPQQQQRGQNNRNANTNQENNEGYRNLGGFNPNNLPDGIRLTPVNPNAVDDLQKMVLDKGNTPPQVNDDKLNSLQPPPAHNNTIQESVLPMPQANSMPNGNNNNVFAHQTNPKVLEILKRFIQNERNCEIFYGRLAESVSNTDIKRKLELYGKQSKDHMMAYSNMLGKRNESYQAEDKNIIRSMDLQEGLNIAVREELEALNEFGELYSMIMDYTEKNILSRILIDKFIRINVMMSYRK